MRGPLPNAGSARCLSTDACAADDIPRSVRGPCKRHEPTTPLRLERSFNTLAPVPPDTRDRILYAALKLFARKGYASTSVADILAEAGVNAGSLYHFFPGKQDVLLAVLDAY